MEKLKLPARVNRHLEHNLYFVVDGNNKIVSPLKSEEEVKIIADALNRVEVGLPRLAELSNNHDLTTTEPTKVITMRHPSSLHLAIQKKAETLGLSMNQYMVNVHTNLLADDKPNVSAERFRYTIANLELPQDVSQATRSKIQEILASAANKVAAAVEENQLAELVA